MSPYFFCQEPAQSTPFYQHNNNHLFVFLWNLQFQLEVLTYFSSTSAGYWTVPSASFLFKIIPLSFHYNYLLRCSFFIHKTILPCIIFRQENYISISLHNFLSATSEKASLIKCFISLAFDWVTAPFFILSNSSLSSIP